MANIQTNYFVTTLKLLHFLHTDLLSFRDNFRRELSSSRNIGLDNKNKLFEGLPLKSYFAVLGTIDPSYKSINYSHFTTDEIAEELINFYENKERRDALEKFSVIEQHYLEPEDKIELPETEPEADIEKRAEKIQEKKEKIADKELEEQQRRYFFDDEQEERSVKNEIQSEDETESNQPQDTTNISQSPTTQSQPDNNFWRRRQPLQQAARVEGELENTALRSTRPSPTSFLRSPSIKSAGKNLASRAGIAGKKGINGAARLGSGLLRAGANRLGQMLGSAGLSAGVGALGWPVLLGIVIILVCIAIFFIISTTDTAALFPPFKQDTSVSSLPPPTSGGGVGTCEYTQGTTSNLKFKSDTLLSWIEREAGANGVPTAILGSIAMHESPNYAPVLTNESNEIKNNRLCNPGQPFCEKNGSNLHQGECNAGELSSGARTGRAMGLMQILDIYNSDIDVCNIQQNIKRGAEILKRGLPAGSSFDQEGGTKRAVCRYFGIDSTVCPYTSSNDYGLEVWNDYQRCLTAPPSLPPPGTPPGPTGPLGFTVTCPLDPTGNSNFATTCGTYDFPAPNGCGHGKPPAYASCDPDIYAECGSVDGTGFRQHGAFLKKSIDIVVPGGSDGKPVYLPYLDGNQSVTWTKTGGLVAIAGGSWGYKQLYTTQFKGKTILLDLTHINSSLTNNGSSLPSGTQVATLFRSGGSFGGAHLHTGLKVDNVPVEPQRQGFMCTARQP